MSTVKEKKTTKPEFRPLVEPGSKFKPVKELFNGYEIEKRWVLMTIEEDHTKQKNALKIYNDALEKGEKYEQGYIKDFQIAIEMLGALGIKLKEFQPNTVRLRKTPKQYILTLKDRKETKKREVEWELDKKTFFAYWKYTKGARVSKTRWETKVKKNTVVFDAFTDRILLMAEIEVSDESLLDGLPKLGMDVTGIKEWTNKSLSR